MPGCFEPTVALRPYVQCYIDFDMSGWPPGFHHGLPDGSINVVLPLEGKMSASTGATTVSDQALVGGLIAAPTLIAYGVDARGIQLQLTPRGARNLLGFPASTIVGGVWVLEDVIGPTARILACRLAEASEVADRVRILDEVLLGLQRDVDDYPQAVDAVWQRIWRSAGTIGVAQLADETGWSRRHLAHLLKSELGITPKDAARLFRFAAARQQLMSGDDPARTASDCGYFDQSHMANDWRRLAGCTPGQWLAQELPFLQDKPDARRAS